MKVDSLNLSFCKIEGEFGVC